MTKDEIKKALRVHASEDMTCDDCPYFERHTDCDYDCGTCHSVAFDYDVLNLVEEQEAEIERLKDKIKQAKIEVLEELKKQFADTGALTVKSCIIIADLIEEVKANEQIF